MDKTEKIEVWHTEFVSSDKVHSAPLEHLHYNQLNDDTWEKYGVRDNYPDYLLSLYRNSNKHNSIIQTKVNLILGKKEFIFEPKNVVYTQLPNKDIQKEEKVISDQEFKKLVDKADAFFKRIQLQKSLRTAAAELCVYGGGFLTLDKPRYTDLDGANPQRKIASIKPQKFIYSRRGKVDVIMGNEPANNYYCVHFPSANKHNSISYSKYNPSNKSSKRKNVLVTIPNYFYGLNQRYQSLYFGIDDISRDVYPTPDYESKGSLASIETDYHLAIFDVAEAKNGFVNDYIYVVYRSRLEDDTKEKIQRDKETSQAQEQFKGAANNGGFIMNWIDPSGMDKEILDAVKNPFIEIPHNKKYNYVSEKRTSVSKEILSAHGVIVAELAGLQGYGSNGFSSQAAMIYAAAEIWEKQRIAPLRSVIEEQIINKLLEDEGIALTAKIKPDPQVQRQLTENLLKEFFDESEIRELFGYAPREKKQEVTNE